MRRGTRVAEVLSTSEVRLDQGNLIHSTYHLHSEWNVSTIIIIIILGFQSRASGLRRLYRPENLHSYIPMY